MKLHHSCFLVFKNVKFINGWKIIEYSLFCLGKYLWQLYSHKETVFLECRTKRNREKRSCPKTESCGSPSDRSWDRIPIKNLNLLSKEDLKLSPDIWSSIHLLPLLQSRIAEAAVPIEMPRSSTPQNIPPVLSGELQGGTTSACLET